MPSNIDLFNSAEYDIDKPTLCILGTNENLKQVSVKVVLLFSQPIAEARYVSSDGFSHAVTMRHTIVCSNARYGARALHTTLWLNNGKEENQSG